MSKSIGLEAPDFATTAAEILNDPVRFVNFVWPDITLYDKQADILYSLRDNEVTVVPAGNDLGKDFVAGLAALWFFCSRTPCRVITTSSGQSQLKSVLWGEIRRFVATAKAPLPIMPNDLMLRYIQPDGSLEPRSYLKGLCTSEEENLQGHHLEWGKRPGVTTREELEAFYGHGLPGSVQLPRTLCIFDEASGIETKFYEAVDTWAHRKLIIGNPLPCTNFFFNFTERGDVFNEDDRNYHFKVIHISGEDSPNVRAAKVREARGKPPLSEDLIPGVLNYKEYKRRRKIWDPQKQCIGIDGRFYKGSEVMMFPPDWLDLAEEYARKLDHDRTPRRAKYMGVDTGEGGDNTVWTIIDELGIIEQISIKTPDTSAIKGTTITLMKEHGIKPENVLFDLGGGGKEHADYLRKDGYKVRTVAFGGAATDPGQYKRMRTSTQKEEGAEQRYTYVNRRVEMYDMLRKLLNPDMGPGFSIPHRLTELRRQLSPLPLQYDERDRMWLPPKDKKNKDSTQVTLKEILGCSPDEADSLVLAVFGKESKQFRSKVTVMK